MSQHWYEVKSNQGIVQVMLGWDPPLQWFHMCIDYDINAAEDPLYTNLAEPDPYYVRAFIILCHVKNHYNVITLSRRPSK